MEEKASGPPHEEKSHDWKEGARLGEADHPGPHQHTLLPQWAQPWVPTTRAVPAAAPTRPWGHKRRKPGLASQAYQARGVGRPHQKQPLPGMHNKQNSVSSGQRWYTGPTSTHSTTNVACRVTRHEGPPSLNKLPTRRMQPQHAPTNTHPNRIQKQAVPCRFGMHCFWKDRFCPYQHPTPMAQAQGGVWARAHRPVRCWFGNRCTHAFCPFEHSGWIARKVSQGVNTNRRDWDPHHAGRGSREEGIQDQNQFKVLQGRTKVQRSMAAVYSGEPVPQGTVHLRNTEPKFSHFSQREKAAIGASTSGRPFSRRTLGAEAGPSSRWQGGGGRGERGAWKRWESRDTGQRRNTAPGQGRPSHSATKGGVPF